jgi:hypothetical protein
MPASIIKRVAAFALRDKQAGELVFTDRNRNIFADEADNEIGGTGAHANEAASAGVNISEHESSQHDETPGIIMETEPNNPVQNLGPTTGAQLGANAEIPHGGSMQDGASAGIPEGIHTEITGVPEGTHIEIPGVSGGDTGIPGVLPGSDTRIPGVPGNGTHNEIPGVLIGTTAGAPEGDTAVPDGTTAGDPEGDPANPTDTEADGISMMDHEDSSTSQPENDNTGVIEDASDSEDKDGDEEETEISDSEVYHPDSMTPSIQRVYGLRPKRAGDYSHLHANIVHHAMTQYSLKRGLNKFKVKAKEAVSKELMQLQKKDTFEPQDVKTLTGDQKKSAIESLMFLKEKRDGTIKGRTCADGRKQREGSTKSKATPPTVELESVLITVTIDAFEKGCGNRGRPRSLPNG